MDFYDNIAKESLEQFNKLPKTGKPSINQWTILSTIIQENRDINTVEVVALGTGTKCIGKSKMSLNGDVLNDSHAEIMCRRSFILYLYSQITSALKGNVSVFKVSESGSKFKLSENIVFHFFTTHIPCGDAAIFPKNLDEDYGEHLLVKNLDIPNKRRKLNEEDIHRTGAKCLKDSKEQDPHLDGTMYHQVSLIRTKPGRGDRTQSVSCSDKIAKWSYMGIQGALLSIILDQPIYLKTLTIAGGIPYNQDSLNRAFNTRFTKDITISSTYGKRDLIINQAKHVFKFKKSEGNKQPCPSSISWYKTDVNTAKPEIAVEGIKQGVTKKKIGSKQARLLISKIELYRHFYDIAKMMKLEGFNENLTYREAKLKAQDYQSAWEKVKTDVFKIWTTKDLKFSSFYIG